MSKQDGDKTQTPPGRPEREHLRLRIRYERDKRGWTQEELGVRLTAVGCPLDRQDVYNIEKAPGRRGPRVVKVDELAALSEVFSIPIEDLLAEPSWLLAGEVAATVEEMGVYQRQMREAHAGLQGCLQLLLPLVPDDKLRHQWLQEAEGLQNAVVAAVVGAMALEEALRDRAVQGREAAAQAVGPRKRPTPRKT